VVVDAQGCPAALKTARADARTCACPVILNDGEESSRENRWPRQDSLSLRSRKITVRGIKKTLPFVRKAYQIVDAGFVESGKLYEDVHGHIPLLPLVFGIGRRLQPK